MTVAHFRGSPRKLNALDKRKLPRYVHSTQTFQRLKLNMLCRSKSVPRPPFTLFTPPSSNESNKRGEKCGFRNSFKNISISVPMNKIVLKPTRPKINLKNIKPKVNTMENTNHKVHISSSNACLLYVINLCVIFKFPLLYINSKLMKNI